MRTVYFGFCYYGLSGQSRYSGHSFVDGPLSLCDSDLGYNDLKFWPLCSEIATIETFGGHYTQWSVVFIGFSDHLVVTYTMQNSILFSDLDPFDGG